ncbi:uncharacterized protein [Euphorbia lathyris]|uniref:uncharacterized protein n=1 Tax=Euphorbia lathyris TaxID=212925 RepID=UPI00331332C7
MQTSSLRSQFHLLGSTNSQTFITPFKTQLPKQIKTYPRRSVQPTRSSNADKTREIELIKKSSEEEESRKGYMRMVVVGGASIGLMLFITGIIDDDQKALAFGPEGPLMEEFWDNVRRYALYALTVSTGALYTILVPIVELLKNPISALLVILIFGGSFFIMSQVLSAMVGVTDFSYDYNY